jgi:predicted chitinase
MSSIKEDIKSDIKENLRNSFEDNTGMLGQVLKERREKQEKNAGIEKEVAGVNHLTEAIKVSRSTLTQIEVYFTQISENFQAINKSFGVVVTLQDKENKTTKDQTATEAVAQKKASVGEITSLEASIDEGPGVLESLLNLFNPFDLLDRAKGKKKPKKPGDKDRKKKQEEEDRKKKQKAEQEEEDRKKKQKAKAKQEEEDSKKKQKAKQEEEDNRKKKLKAEQEELEKNKEKIRSEAESKSKAAKEKALKEGKSVKDAEQAGAKAAKKVVKKANADAVKKVARKFILAKIGKVVVKTIPIIGSVVAVGFLVDSIWDAIKSNNYTKVGAEAAGLIPIVGGAASAVGNAAAETYMELYGTDYLTDKANGVEGADAAWVEVNKIVAEEFEKAVKEALFPSVERSVVSAKAKTRAVKTRPESLDKEQARNALESGLTDKQLEDQFEGGRAALEKVAGAKPTQKQEAVAPVPVPPKLPPPPPAPAPAPPPAPLPPPAPSAKQAPVEQIREVVKPKAAAAASGIVGTIINALKSAGIASEKAISNILATIKAETGFRVRSEELTYKSPERIQAVFGKKRIPTLEFAQPLVGNPEALANEVYKNTDGNKEQGDGYKFRGRGFIQHTGRNQYEGIAKFTKTDVVANPDLLNDPVVATKALAWFFLSYKRKKIDQLEDISEVNKAVGFADDKAGTHAAERAQSATQIASSMNSGQNLETLSTQVASKKTDIKREQPNDVTVISVNETNRKRVAA